MTFHANCNKLKMGQLYMLQLYTLYVMHPTFSSSQLSWISSSSTSPPSITKHKDLSKPKSKPFLLGSPNPLEIWIFHCYCPVLILNLSNLTLLFLRWSLSWNSHNQTTLAFLLVIILIIIIAVKLSLLSCNYVTSSILCYLTLPLIISIASFLPNPFSLRYSRFDGPHYRFIFVLALAVSKF